VTLRKGLTRLEGVADAKLIIKPPHMQVRMKPGYWPDLPRMQQTIKDAGYKPIEDGVDLRVTGKVVKQAGAPGAALAVQLDGMKTPTTLPVVAAKDDPDTAAHLNRHLGHTVELEGQWQPAPEGQAGPGSLAVTAIYGAEDRKPTR
jgi:hypothetical protein